MCKLIDFSLKYIDYKINFFGLICLFLWKEKFEEVD